MVENIKKVRNAKHAKNSSILIDFSLALLLILPNTRDDSDDDEIVVSKSLIAFLPMLLITFVHFIILFLTKYLLKIALSFLCLSPIEVTNPSPNT